MGACQQALDRTGLARACSTHAGVNPAEIALLKPSLGQRFAACRQNRVPNQFRVEADIGWAARSFPQQIALRIAQARPALGAAAINAKEQEVGHARMHLKIEQSDGTMPLNVQFGKRRRPYYLEPFGFTLWMQKRKSADGNRQFPSDPAEGELCLYFVDTNMRSLVQRIDQ